MKKNRRSEEQNQTKVNDTIISNGDDDHDDHDPAAFEEDPNKSKANDTFNSNGDDADHGPAAFEEEDDEGVCEYEKIRQQNIADRKRKLEEMGLGHLVSKLKKPSHTKTSKPAKFLNNCEDREETENSSVRTQPERMVKKKSNDPIVRPDSEDESTDEDSDFDRYF